jgi:hypothetical protein
VDVWEACDYAGPPHPPTSISPARWGRSLADHLLFRRGTVSGRVTLLSRSSEVPPPSLRFSEFLYVACVLHGKNGLFVFLCCCGPGCLLLYCGECEVSACVWCAWVRELCQCGVSFGAVDCQSESSGFRGAVGCQSESSGFRGARAASRSSCVLRSTKVKSEPHVSSPFRCVGGGGGALLSQPSCRISHWGGRAVVRLWCWVYMARLVCGCAAGEGHSSQPSQCSQSSR